MLKGVLSISMFIVVGMFGPLIRFVVSVNEMSNIRRSSVFGFMNDLVFLMWPTSLFGVVETNIGIILSTFLTVGMNILLFGLLGVAVIMISKLCGRFIGSFGTLLFVWVLLILWALWGAGFSFSYINIYAFALAILLYALPFFITFAILKNDRV